MRRDRGTRPWHLYLLGVIAVVVAVLAVIEIGPPSSSARTSREIVTAQDGVVQSTVTGTGNIAAGTDDDVNFKTSGTLETVDVSTGQHVSQGQLLAQLDPAAAQLTLDQAEESLTAAQLELTAAENGTSSGSGSGGSGSGSTGASYTGAQGSTEFVSETTRTTPKRSGSTRTQPSGNSSVTRTVTVSAPATSTPKTTTTTTPSPSAIASAQAAVYGAQANVDNAEQALANTKLYAPVSGTIASMADLVPGDSVTGGSTSNAASSSSSSSSTSGSGTGGTGSSTSTAGSLGGSSSSSSSSGSSSSSSSPFAEIINTSTLSMTVSFSESDISKVHTGQAATVTLDALPGVELAAHVSQISSVGTTSSGVVSYDATITLDQSDSQIKPGMSASATVIVGQAQGVNVPNSAVTGSGSLGTVNLLRDGKTVQQQVVVGLRGDSRTQIISGVSSGQQLVVTVALPALSTSTTSTSGSSGTLGGSGAGRFGGGGGFFGGGGGGGGAFFRGGGG
ncbi:MAG TPA: HlyD family efflux transporter periplasmic adaptor subunit [Solirubrobacteraceae bacterium]|nr:HlyD family efflux transporter periplasmic adaptor subunit [Solirubrobacteraceae bacterium]